MSAAVIEWVKRCEGCTASGRPERPVPMKRSILPVAPWEALAVDFNGKHGECGGRMVAVVVDYFTRYLVARFVKSTDIASLVKFLDSIFEIFGHPRTIRSDNGPPFNGNEWRQYCEKKSIVIENSTPGFPQQNGMVERYMQTVNKAVTIAVETGKDADQALAEAVKAHNAAKHRVTNEAPEELMFGRKVRRNLPLLVGSRVTVDHEKLRDNDWHEKKKAGERENRKRRAKETDIQVGDNVLLKRVQKSKDQTPFGLEKYRVVEKHQGDIVMVGPNGERVKRNVTHLKKAVGTENEVLKDVNLQGSSVHEPREKRLKKAPQKLHDYVWVLNE